MRRVREVRGLICLCIWAGLWGLAPQSLHAALLDVINPGFEDRTVGPGNPSGFIFNEFSFGPPNGWELYDPHSVTGGGTGPTFFVGTLTPTILNPPDYEFFPDGAPEGQRVAIAFNYFGSGDAGEYGLQQTLDGNITANTLQPHTTYTLMVEVGDIASGTSVSNDFFNLNGFPGYRIDLLAGGVVIASDNNTLAGSLNDGEFATSIIEFTVGEMHAQLNEALGIRLVSLNVVDASAPLADLEVDFDNVRLYATPVPEPAAFACILWLAAAASTRRGRCFR